MFLLDFEYSFVEPKIYTENQIVADFSTVLIRGDVRSAYDYYEFARAKGVQFSSKIAKHIGVL